MKKVILTFSFLSFFLAGLITLNAQTNTLHDDPPVKTMKKDKSCKSKKKCCSSKSFDKKACKDTKVKEVKTAESKSTDLKDDDQ